MIDIAAIRAALEAATPRPWTQLIDSYDDGTMFLTADPTDTQKGIGESLSVIDATLITLTVNNIEALLAENERLRGVVEAARKYVLAMTLSHRATRAILPLALALDAADGAVE